MSFSKTAVLATAAGMCVSLFVNSAAHAISAYAVSYSKVSSFGVSAQSANLELNGFIFSNDAVADGVQSSANVDAGLWPGNADADPSCIGACSGWSNEFQQHLSTTSHFVYGDAQILSVDILNGTGSASTIAEAYVENGSAFATGSNSLSGQVTLDAASIVDFNFGIDSLIAASGTGGGASASLSMALLLSNGTNTWSWNFAALGEPTVVGMGSSSSYTDSYSGSSGLALSAGTYDLELTMSNKVNVSAVPVPAAVWLFGSGLLGLVAVARRRNP